MSVFVAPTADDLADVAELTLLFKLAISEPIVLLPNTSLPLLSLKEKFPAESAVRRILSAPTDSVSVRNTLAILNNY